MFWDLTPRRHDALSSLVRALFRFYFNEWEYNGHLGGDGEPESLLSSENEIVEHGTTPGFPRSAETSEAFLVGLFYPPYPDYDKGIAVYAGYYDGMMSPPLTAIRTSPSSLYENIAGRLEKDNYFDVESEFEKDLAKLHSGIRATLPASTVMYRARIGIAKRFMQNFGGWTSDLVFQPYLGTEIGSPPPEKATPGRLNRDGVSFLYLSTNEETSVSEVRPHPGHRVSVGAFRCLQDIQIADFGNIDVTSFSASDAQLAIFHLGHTISREISLPITPEERHKYSVTQLLADILRRQGYDGIRFPSSVAAGTNACIFRPVLFSPVADSGKVFLVRGLKYEIESSDYVIEPTDEDILL
jgi:hypothetical protein